MVSNETLSEVQCEAVHVRVLGFFKQEVSPNAGRNVAAAGESLSQLQVAPQLEITKACTATFRCSTHKYFPVVAPSRPKWDAHILCSTIMYISIHICVYICI